MKVLFVSYGGGHVNMIVPVVQRLRRRPDWEVTVCGLTTAAAVWRREGVPWLGFRDLVTDDDGPALEEGRRLASGLDAATIDPRESIAYLGLSYWDLVERHGADEARRRYAELGRQALLPIGVMQRLIRHRRPDVVVATSSPRAERAAILAARRCDVPAVCLVDLFIAHEIEWLAEPDFADRVCVNSEFTRGRLLEAGREPRQVVVTGNPAFDVLAREGIKQEAARLRHQRGWHGKTVIVWASQHEPGNVGLPRQIDRELIRIVRRRPDWHLVIRLHPSESVSLDGLPQCVTVSPREEDLGVLLSASDVVVTMTSTVGLEGALLGKPLVSVELAAVSPMCQYAKMGISVPVWSLDELAAGLERALADNLCAKVQLPNPGEATGAVIDVIESLCGT